MTARPGSTPALVSDGTTPFEPFPRADLEGSLVARFARQVARHGERLAVKMGRHRLTYAELDRAANQIAHALLARLGSSNEPVALLLPQGPRQVAAVLGALKAGKIYVPLNVAQAAGRLGPLVADSGARLVVTDSPHLEAARGAAPNAHLLDLDALPRDETHEAPDLAIAPDAGAYIFYTSGSTGTPKGVLDTHRNVLHNVMRYTNTLRFGPEDRLTLLQGPSFSGAVSSLFGALLNGAASFPFDVPREGPEAIAPWLAAEAITIYHSVPALFRHVAPHGAALPALRVIRLEGDRATVRDLEIFAAHFAGSCVLVNGLGATECGLVRQFFFRPGQALPDAVVPIGGPVEDMDVMLLDEAGRPAPRGEVGEIAVRSAYLASGYWRRPDLTARRFLPDPERPGVRMYLTGDTGRLHADGMLDYLGRQDGLAKVRGQRVEAAEVETVLLALPGVAEAAVMVREDRAGEPRVVAYLVPRAEGVPPVGTLRRALAQRLPDFMLPTAFVTLPHLPLDDNGKVDRRALPPPPAARPALDRPAVAPRNTDEATIARLWSAALGFEGIGVEDDFFELGGDSLRAALMLAEVRKATGLELGAAAFAEAPTVAAIARRVTAARQRAPRATTAGIPPRAAGDPTLPRASFAQEALWFLDQLDPGTALYNVAPAWRLRGPLDVAALEQSLQWLVDRHEALRTVFVAVDGQPHQRVLSALTVPLPMTDCSALAAEDREAAVTRASAEERRRGFDLARGPLIRARLFRLSPVDHVLTVTVHHIVTDGWSMDVLARELGLGYRSARGGQKPEMPPLPIQFADFAVWQRERLSEPRLSRLLDYWRERLAGRPAAPALPPDRPRPARPTFQGGRERLAVPADTLAAVRALGREEGATLYMVLLAAFALVLSRRTGQTDLLLGSPLADRTRRETWSGIGLYLNTLVLRIDLSGSPSFRELIRRVRATALDAFDHQELPFDRLVEALRPERSATTPFLSALFNLHNQPSSGLALEGLEVRPELAAPPRPKFELNLAVEETPGGLAGALVYDAEIFEAETMRRFLDAYRHLLTHAASEPDRRIAEIALMGEEERARVLALGRGPLAPPPPARSIHAAVAAQAARTPEARALVLGDTTLSYADLERRANRLARHLRALEGGPDLRVGVCLPRSPELIVALLAVLKAGGAYIALDPAEPPARLGVMLGDAGARAVITSDALARRCGGHGRVVVRVDTDAAAIAREDDTALETDVAPGDLAYIAYTSGSTGRPKGVPTAHRGVLSYLDFLVRRFELGPADTVLQICRTSFDASVREIFGPLTSGGCVVLLPDDEAADPEAIVARLREHRVTALLALVPSLLRPAAAAAERSGGVETLRLILTTGEPLRFTDARLVERVLAPHAALVNQYGPTECTMTSTWYPVSRGEGGASGDALVPIGRPIANVHVYVLDDGGGLVPPGVPGELHIGGVGVASGYLGDRDLTARRFVPDPFAEAPDARMFKTGDLVRSRADGTLEFLGRMDRQVKVRGIRVEPGETEHVLVTHPAVAEAAVIPWEAAPGDQRLAAYVVACEGAALDVAELRRFARERLPAPLVPSAVVVLAALPLTPNGKLDRAALPLPDPATIAGSGEYVAPSTPLETAIAQVWSDVLGVPRIGVTDDFFELGGHSLLATRLLVRLRDRLGLELSLRQLFEAPTIAGMVDTLLEQELAQGEAEPAEAEPASLAAVLARHADQTPEAPAILRPGRAALSYRELADEVTRIGGALADAGLGRGARVAVVMPQGPDLAVALLGVTCAATALPLDPAAPRPELERVLAAARVDAVIVPPGDLTPAGEAAHALGMRVITLEATTGARAGAGLREMPRPEDVAVVLHTSGTTARPKRVPLTHANLLASARGHGRALALTPQDRCLNLMPLHHVNGLGMLIASLVAGAAAVCPPRFDPTRVFAWLDETRPTWLNATPALHHAMLTVAGLDAAGAGRTAARASLRLIRSASSPLPARVMRDLEALFQAPVIESYGQTETATLATVAPLPPHPRPAGSVGVPAGPEVAFLGEDGRVTPGLRQGEVVVRGANVMAGYEDDPAACAAAFVEGWFRTGDLGRLDDEGQLHLSGRIHDIINRGGEKVAPREIEELLLSHPDVAEAVAFAVPHPSMGEDVAAAVVPRPGAVVAPEALRRFAAERIAESRVPHRIAVLTAIPTGATGKPDRAACARALHDLEEPERHPLSASQAQLWVLDRLQPGAPVYSMPRAFRLGGRLDVGALERALTAMVARHAALRTVYHAIAGDPVQEVRPPRAVPLPLVDLGALSPSAREEALAARLDAEARRPFDLSQDLMLRAALYRLEPEAHVLFVNMHHIASDGRSYGVFYEELAALYARETGRPTPAPALPALTYGAHARSQRERLAGPSLEAEIAYWRRRLAGAPADTGLPTDRPRPAVLSHRGGLRSRTLPSALLSGLRALARETRATLFMTLLAAFQTLLHRESGETDIVTGIAVSGRTPELASLIGYFVNTVPVRSDLGGDPSFRQLVERVRAGALETYEHADLPFARLVEAVAPERRLDRSPLVQVMLVQDDARQAEAPPLAGLEVRPLPLDPGVTKLDLTVTARERPEGLRLTAEYSADLFDPETIERLLTHFECLIASVVATPDRPLSELSLLPEAERAQLDAWSQGPPALVSSETLLDAIAGQAARRPGAIAIESDAGALTYGELMTRAGALARHLRRLGVGPDRPVGVCMHRGPELLPAVLAVLQAGGTYLPLDPETPLERLRFILDDAQPLLVLADPPVESRLRKLDARVVCPGSETEALGHTTGAALAPVSADTLAYVMYTSGSTGRPKGVLVPHRAIAHHARWMQQVLPLQEDDAVLGWTPLGFDPSVWEMLGPLAAGARLVLAPPDAHRDPRALADIVAKAGITVLQTLPGVLAALCDQPAFATATGLRRILCGGEALDAPLAARVLRDLGVELINLYGPTEATIDATWWRCRAEDTRVPIGRPIAGARVLVLDPHGEPTPVGVPGEIHIEGAGVARGYLNQPRLTAERFVAGGTRYRTGDRARWRSDGALEFLGRLDRQVKLRGVRIEPGEIEAALVEHVDVGAAAVAVREEPGVETHLVAWVTPRAGCAPDREALRRHLAARLPAAMMPAAIVLLDSLPMLSAGKVDLAALPAPGADARLHAGVHEAPRTEPERALAALWQELLGVARVGRFDDFFALGGHSLLAARLAARLEERLGVEVPLRRIFETPILADLARACPLRESAGPAVPVDEPAARAAWPGLVALGSRSGDSGPAPAPPATAGPAALEARVAAILSEVLGAPMEPDDDFIASGGDSLLAAVALARIADAVGAEVRLAEFFAAPTAAAVAARIASRHDAEEAH